MADSVKANHFPAVGYTGIESTFLYCIPEYSICTLRKPSVFMEKRSPSIFLLLYFLMIFDAVLLR